MKKNNSFINYLVTKFLVPYMLCFAAYIQIFGEIGPGGGFQAGAIFASIIIAYDLSVKNIADKIDQGTFLRIGSIGALTYILTGVYSLLCSKNFLNYYSLGGTHPQGFGIMLIELGVGITVASIMIFLYLEFKKC